MNGLINFVKTNLQSQTVFACAAILLGCGAMFSPFISGLLFSMLLAVTMGAIGLTGLVWLFKEEKTSTKIWMGLLSMTCMVSAFYMYHLPGQTLIASTLFLIALFFVEGIYSLVMGIKHRKQKGSGWTIFYSILSVICGVLLVMDWPLTGFYAVGIYVGAKLLYIGFALLTVTAAETTIAEEAKDYVDEQLAANS